MYIHIWAFNIFLGNCPHVQKHTHTLPCRTHPTFPLAFISSRSRSLSLSLTCKNTSTPTQDTAPHTSIHCNSPHHTAVQYNTLQHTATHCNTHCKSLQVTATRSATRYNIHYITLQHSARHCNTSATRYSIHCNTL